VNQTIETLLCRPDAASEVLALIKKKQTANTEPVKTAPWEEVEFEDSEDMESNHKVAVVRASGVLALGVSGYWGCCDLEELADEIEEADNDANITAIVVEMDSPGGTVNGTPEAAKRIASISKPILFWTSRQMCSAAYWLASSADMIAAAPSAIVGSIGCVLAFYDQSKFYDQLGFKVDVFRSGDLKAAGFPGTALSDAERAHFQATVDEVAGDFQTTVLEFRTNLELGLFDGRTVTGKMAEPAGLVDGVYTTRDEAIADFLTAFA
jgi:signal peptide peptidase SppA